MNRIAWILALGLTTPGAHADELDFLFDDTPTQAVAAPGPPATDTPSSADTAMPVDTAEDAIDTTIAVEPLRPEAPAVASPQAPAARNRQIEEVVVTAQKTEQSIQDVPISVTAIGGDFIQETGAADLTDVSAYVPNVRVDTDDLGSPQVFIRGFGTNTFNPAFESSVGFVQDEIFFGRGGYFTEAMFDIERIEVLRGPQGTLFGKNTVAGVFNVLSKSPTDELSANLRYQVGEHGERRLEGGVGGMFSDSFGARLSVLDARSDGELHNQYLDRSEDELEQRAGRLKLLFHPSDSLKMELTAVDSETQINFWPYQLYQLDEGTRGYLQAWDSDIEDDPYDFVTSFDTLGFLEKGSTTFGLKTDWSIGPVGGLQDLDAVLVLGTSRFYIDQLNDLDVSPADLLYLVNYEDHDQRSAELRFTGRADSLFGLGTGLDFVAGAYWFDSSYTLLAQIQSGGDLGSFILTDDFLQLVSGQTAIGLFTRLGLPALPILGEVLAPVLGEDYYQYDFAQDISATALFGQFTWHLGDRWALTPGVRINREEKTVDSAGTAHCRLKDAAGLPICVVGLVLGANDYDQRDLGHSETEVSPKLSLQYFWNGDLNLFVTYARGYKSGGFNALSYTGEDLQFEPEIAQTLEAGFKGQFLDRSLNLNLTVYRTELDDLQVLAFNGAFFDVGNAASAISEGLEADFLWLTPFEPLSLAGSVGLLDARYDRYPEAPAPISQGQDQLQDLSGKRIAFAPRMTATLTPTLTVTFHALMARLGIDLLYQGDQYTDTDLDPNTYVDDTLRISARISLGSQSGLWMLTLGGSNLTDERTLNQVTDALLFPGTYYAQQAAGRQLFAALQINW